MRWRFTSHAKVNLALAVGPAIASGQPQAGYHTICSWMHAIDLADELEIALDIEWLGRGQIRNGEATTYTRHWDDGRACEWPEDADLAVRAHRLIERELARPVPVRLHITKRIPAGGGLGGGSSNAASVLMALNAMLGSPVAHARLLELGLSLGSDVGFFLDEACVRGVGDKIELGPTRPALVEGLGERITRLARTRGEIMLIVPPFGCETRSVYRAFDALMPGPMRDDKVREAVAKAEGGESIGSLVLGNDLMEPAMRVEPRLREVYNAVKISLGRPVMMSGSGSTLWVVGGDFGSGGAGATMRRIQAEARVLRVHLV
jgi:4-diphosphocytidyl-2-C-methyl-D-erythritol kinase